MSFFVQLRCIIFAALPLLLLSGCGSIQSKEAEATRQKAPVGDEQADIRSGPVKLHSMNLFGSAAPAAQGAPLVSDPEYAEYLEWKRWQEFKAYQEWQAQQATETGGS